MASTAKLILTFLTLLLRILCITSQTQQSVILNVSTPSLPGISISTNSQEVNSSSGTEWDVHIDTQYGSTFNISMDSSWCFHPTVPSTISIILNGKTPEFINASVSDDYADMLLLFAVNNTEYFSTGIHLDEQRHAFKIYPGDDTPIQTDNDVRNNIIYQNTPNRWPRFSNNDQFVNLKPLYKKQAVWPMYIALYNDPIQNILIFTWNDSNIEQLSTVLSVTYNTSFTTNSGMDVYITGESEDEEFILYSVEIDYQFIDTASPTTKEPTIFTEQPTRIPITISPTNQPTTGQPTTNRPTTNTPTTIQPTLYPITLSPTTLSPTTLQPTYLPITNMPITNQPTTNIPTNIPITLIPITQIPTTNQPITPIPTTQIPTQPTTTSSPVTSVPTQPTIRVDVSTTPIIKTTISNTDISWSTNNTTSINMKYNKSLLDALSENILIIAMVILLLILICIVYILFQMRSKKIRTREKLSNGYNNHLGNNKKIKIKSINQKLFSTSTELSKNISHNNNNGELSSAQKSKSSKSTNNDIIDVINEMNETKLQAGDTSEKILKQISDITNVAVVQSPNSNRNQLYSPNSSAADAYKLNSSNKLRSNSYQHKICSPNSSNKKIRSHSNQSNQNNQNNQIYSPTNPQSLKSPNSHNIQHVISPNSSHQSHQPKSVQNDNDNNDIKYSINSDDEEIETAGGTNSNNIDNNVINNVNDNNDNKKYLNLHKAKRSIISDVSLKCYANADDEKDDKLIKTPGLISPGNVIKGKHMIEIDVFPDDENDAITAGMGTEGEKSKSKLNIVINQSQSDIDEDLPAGGGITVNNNNVTVTKQQLPPIPNSQSYTLNQHYLNNVSNNSKRPSASISHKSFITVISEEKQIQLNNDDDDDDNDNNLNNNNVALSFNGNLSNNNDSDTDDGLDDPEHEQAEKEKAKKKLSKLNANKLFIDDISTIDGTSTDITDFSYSNKDKIKIHKNKNKYKKKLSYTNPLIAVDDNLIYDVPQYPFKISVSQNHSSNSMDNDDNNNNNDDYNLNDDDDDDDDDESLCMTLYPHDNESIKSGLHFKKQNDQIISNNGKYQANATNEEESMDYGSLANTFTQTISDFDQSKRYFHD